MNNNGDEVFQRGFREGIEKGKEMQMVEDIRHLMKNLSADFYTAADFLELPESEYGKYRELVDTANEAEEAGG